MGTGVFNLRADADFIVKNAIEKKESYGLYDETLNGENNFIELEGQETPVTAGSDQHITN